MARLLTTERLIKNILAKSPHLTEPEVEEAVYKILDIMMDHLGRHVAVKIYGFGKWEIWKRNRFWVKGTKTLGGWPPKYVPVMKYDPTPKYYVKFIPSEKRLRDKVNYQDDNFFS